jgi:hypothetical protein
MDGTRNHAKIRVFISSTWQDLEPERQAVEKAVRQMRDAAAIAVEYVESGPDSTHDVSLQEVDRSDVYVGIIGFRYDSGRTEAEYRRAIQRGIPVLLYVKHPDVPIPPSSVEPTERGRDRLEALTREMEEHHTVSRFMDPNDLSTLLVADLGRAVLPRQENGAVSRLHGLTHRFDPSSSESDPVDVERELDDVTARLTSELRAKRPDLFNASGRPKKGALEKAVQEHTGKKKLNRADILELLRKKSS